MDFEQRKTQKYVFKSPVLEDLRKLGRLVADPEAFKVRYGGLLSLLKINMVEGVLATLVQFYDPVYHCFTFPDYQLAPTLEEYSQLIDLPITNRDLFSGLERILEDQTITRAISLEESDVRAHRVTKGGIQGLPAKFLTERALSFASVGNLVAFEIIYVLLIYGIFLFPNIDYFVDVNAIRIFLIRNPVPTLLADAYHSVHLRNLHGGGMITCCVPILYMYMLNIFHP